ncbi:MAG: 3-methyl-2-oxobutanoate hydroxymethyltransferase, partial [Actinomycetota bacterium]|nr:3-methyl-2-oxobutanoate hydroxymethyltransferase [Actinomycetota bacterium]
YQVSVDEGMRNAGRHLQEAGAHAVKLEGGKRVAELVGRLTDAGIPVMGHLGLTPQSVNQFGGWRVQGREEEQAHRILQDAKSLEAAGAFALVLEAVPPGVGQEVTRSIHIPTIGIGAGPHTDGQVLVWHDFLGITPGRLPKYVKRYASLGDEIKRAATAFAADVAAGAYPAPEHTYE